MSSSETIAEFCLKERISRAAYYDLRKRGLGPDEFQIPGTRIKRITPEAHAAWRERMTELAKSEAGRLEAERRRELAKAAGEKAAASPKHVTKARARRRGHSHAAE